MSKALRDESCERRIDYHLKQRLADLRDLWAAYCNSNEEGFSEYGLCFDFVPPDTFPEQREGYFRYQLSWGGPSDELRFFTNPDFSCHRVEYWFSDWFDGANRVISTDYGLLSEIWERFRETGAVESAYAKAGAR